jgi:hypothetical protein
MTLGVLKILAASGGYTFTVNPTTSGSPGASGLQKLIDAVGGYALIGCTLGFLIGCVAWAMGNHFVNEMASSRGKVSALVSLGAAALIGGAAVLLGYSYNLFG